MTAESKTVWQAVQSFIRETAKSGRPVCVLAPWFVPAREGYLQRVAAIDAEVLDPLPCIHLDFETGCAQPCARRMDARHLLVELLPHHAQSLQLAKKIARACGVMYIHSVMRAMRDVMGERIDELFCLRGVYRIWDVHGAVPEEYVMQPNFYEAQNATHAEELLLRQAHTVVTISESMRRHFDRKYGVTLQNTINTSVFNVTQVDFDGIAAAKLQAGGKQTAAYAGNLMPWQNIPLLQRLMEQAGDAFDYRIYTPQPQEFAAMAEDLAMPPYTVQCVSPQQVLESYRDCHFGFALRDDSAVNRVACPTKIMEYIQFGLVPVLKSPHIGDFEELGLCYIPMESFSGLCMSPQEHQRVIRHNYAILEKLQQMHETGIAQLRALVHSKAKGKG